MASDFLANASNLLLSSDGLLRQNLLPRPACGNRNRISTHVNKCVKPLELFCRGQPREHSWLPNEEGYATADMESDHLHVPAF